MIYETRARVFYTQTLSHGTVIIMKLYKGTEEERNKRRVMEKSTEGMKIESPYTS